jgi:hypothetical protein
MELYDELKLGDIRMSRKVFGEKKEEVKAIEKLVFVKPNKKEATLVNKSLVIQRKGF